MTGSDNRVLGKDKLMQTEERIKHLQGRMQEEGVNLVAIAPTSNMRYLLGFSTFADERLCTLLIYEHDIVIVAPGMSIEEIAARTAVNVIPWIDSDGPREALRQVQAKHKKAGILAVDSAMRADNMLLLLDELNPAKVVPADGLLSPLRLVKSEVEISLLAHAASQADKAMQAAIESCQPGVTEKEIAWAAGTAFMQNGADEVCFTIVASGPNGAFPHHHSSDRKLQRGDTIIIDIGASTSGYKSDITRVVHLGKPDTEVLQVYDAVKQANQSAMAAVKPGVTAESIDLIARSFLEEAGYGEAFVHRTGHGIGLDVHEAPWIMLGDKTVLQEGMAFSVEPGVYLPGRFGVRVEDIVAVTGNGVQSLSGFDRSLVIKD